jgi:hypothetical protein
MRRRYHRLVKTLVMLVVIALAACGASNAEIKTAKIAQYNAPTETLYQIALQTAAEEYKIGDTNPSEGTFMTTEQWYSPEGGRQSSGAGDYVQLDDRSILLMLIVEIEGMDAGKKAIVVTPKVFQHLSGSPKPRELLPDDPGMPGWVHGRVDDLALAIYNNAKKYADAN